MAQRIATEYVNASLQLTPEEMAGFVRFFEDQHVRHQVRVLENGNHEMVLEDDAGREEVRLTFERQQDRFIGSLSCRIIHPKLTNAMRKAVAAFRGDAVVNRIYPSYTMTYHYVQGNVRKIVEQKSNEANVIFEFKNTIGQIETAYRAMNIEQEIQAVQGAIDQLLDLRNQSGDREQIRLIDERLTSYTKQLFMLEA